jgi:hypothetical protein
VELLHICIRRTLPWHDEEAVSAALDERMRPRAALWNATFSLRYAAFRLRLSQITRENLSRVENAKLSRVDELPPGGLIVPVDDDDWLSPEIGIRLLAARGDAPQGFHWNPYILRAPRRSPRWPWSRVRRAADTSPHTCGSNNYAVRKLPDLVPAITNHVWASRYFDDHPRRVRRLDASLSVQNRNLGSRTTLADRAPGLSREQLLERYRKYRRLYHRLRLPSEVAWAQPCVDAMAELMHELRTI